MRDHTKLRAFQLADGLALAVYQATKCFPKHELFGLTAQMRRSAVSVASNIVEGCARRSEADYVHFLDMAFGSARELEYQARLAHRLGYFTSAAGGGSRGVDGAYESLQAACDETCRVLNGLIRSLRA